MNWSAAKNWLIVLFVGINLFLIFTLTNSNMQSSVIEKETISSTIDILKKSNVFVDEKVIPTKMPKLGSIDVENNITNSYEFAQRIISPAVAILSDSHYAFYTKRLTLDGDMFFYSDTNPEDNISDFKASTAQHYALKWLAERDFKTDTLKPYTSQGDGFYTVTLEQKIDRYALLDSYIKLTVTPNGITEMSGTWFVPSSGQNLFSNDAAQVRSIVSVLLDFARDSARINQNGITISQIDLGYTTGDKKTYHKYATAVPVWRIRCNTGVDYFFEAR